ncbi:MAG: tripartite tricarboxylate transporter permease [Rhodospirillales bacterium]
MEYDMLTMAIKAATIMADPIRLLFLFFGVLIGLTLGIIPGLGGIVGLSLLLPFTFDMDPYTALAFMLGLGSVTTTSDTIPAVLFGVPGTTGSAATVLDGHPLSQQGQAGRAFGAAFSASLIGGVFGAFLLAISVPILRPFILHIGSPELLMFCVFGLSLAAVLSGGAALKGLAAAALGVLVATVGEDPHSGVLRWTFDTTYLWDGIPLVPVALGLFALTEIADMVIAGGLIIKDKIQMARQADQWRGIRDTLSHKFLVARCATIGAFIGAVPGMGASVIDWIAYGHAAATEKDARKTFGTGDIRGVIASESSNNAKEGGALIPTIAFGVPGSASMALFLAFFLVHGIIPGPGMLTKQLDITYTMVWSVALANILGAGICFAFANQLAKIVLVRIGILAPMILAIVFIGVFQKSKDWGDLYTLLIFAVIGWTLKRLGWPRPPVLLGVVLGALVERYMFISVQAYGFTFLTRPIVVTVLAITVLGVLWPFIRDYRKRDRAVKLRLGTTGAKFSVDTGFTLVMIAFFVFTILSSRDWELSAKVVPQFCGWTGLIFCTLQLLKNFFVSAETVGQPGTPEGIPKPAAPSAIMDIKSMLNNIPRREIGIRAAGYLGWLLFFLGTARVIGLLPSVLVFLICFMRIHGKEPWKTTLITSGLMWAFAFLVFHYILSVPWPPALIGDMYPHLREIIALY